MENKDIYKSIAGSLNAWRNCVKSDNKEWEDKHEQAIIELINELPHGSGLDGDWTLDFDKSNDYCLVFYMQYHCMNENGMYDGWMDFTLKVKPSLQFGFNLFITGNLGKYSHVKEYLYEELS